MAEIGLMVMMLGFAGFGWCLSNLAHLDRIYHKDGRFWMDYCGARWLAVDVCNETDPTESP